MEKRLPLALFLSLLVLFVWTFYFAPPPEETTENGEAGTELSTGGSGAPGAGGGEGTGSAEVAPPPSLSPAVGEDSDRTLELFVGNPAENGEHAPGAYRALFSNRGARLVRLDMGDYYTSVGLSAEEHRDPENWFSLIEPVETNEGTLGSLLWKTSHSSNELAPLGLEDVLWKMEEVSGAEPGVVFTYGPGTGVIFKKRITFVPDAWQLRVTLEIENLAAGPAGRRDFVFVPAGCVPGELGDQFYPEPRAIAAGWDRDDEVYEVEWEDAPGVRGESGSLDVPVPLALAGVTSKYFAFLMRPADVDSRQTMTAAAYESVIPLVERVRNGNEFDWVSTDVSLALRMPPQGERQSWQYIVYAGPKDKAQMVADYEAHDAVLGEDLSTFASIGKLLLLVLGFLEGLVGNWGVAIILLTLCVRLILFPLNRRSQTAMARYQKKMKRVQPKLNEIKERFKDDPQKQREAQAKIMQEEGAFPPLGGCMPVFLQIPIFWGLFTALRTSFDLRQAPFYGWIDDLSRPDRLLYLGWDVPLLPNLTYLNLLPLLMVALWILQQRGMPKPTDEQAARMQKMMTFMPILFGFMLYNYAAGLSLYMITQSTLGIIEQRVIKKVWPIDDTEVEPKKKGAGCGPFSGMMQNIAEKQKEQMKLIEARQRAQKAQQQKKQASRKKKRR